jgi:hypothetical protein
MPLPPMPHVARIAHIGYQNDQEIVNTIHFRFATAVDNQVLQELGTVCNVAWAARIMPNVSIALSSTGVEARQAVPGSGYGVDVPRVTTIYGSITADSKDQARSTVIALKSGRTGRSYNGRWHIAGLPDNTVTAGRIDATYRENLANQVRLYFADIQDNMPSALPVIVSYFSNGAQRVTPWLEQILTARSITKRPGHMSSREQTD